MASGISNKKCIH